MTLAAISAGDRIEPLNVTISAPPMKVWARALHDANPIHLDPAAVSAMGLGERVINQGPANLAYVFNLVAARFPDAAIERSSARFIDNAFDGDVLTASGKVASVEPAPGGRRIRCELDLATTAGRPVLSAIVDLLMPSAAG